MLTGLRPDQVRVTNHITHFRDTRPYGAAIGGRTPKSHMGYSVRTDSWRYTTWYNLEKDLFEFHELYAPEAPGPTVNLSGKSEYTEVRKKLHQMVVDYQAGNQVHGKVLAQ